MHLEGWWAHVFLVNKMLPFYTNAMEGREGIIKLVTWEDKKKQGLHPKQAKTSHPHKPTMKKTNTILIDEINQWAPYVDIKKSTSKMKKTWKHGNMDF